MVAYVTELNEDMYKDFVKDGLVLVDIKAEWCGPCKVVGPIVDEISSNFYGKLSVGKLDADSASDTISSLGVRNIPTLLLYKGGEVIERHTGMITKEKLNEMIESHLD